MAIPQERLRITDRVIDRPESFAALAPARGRLSWAGVWSGFLTGVGLMLLLSVLGLAIGATAAGPNPAAGSPIGAGAGALAVLGLLFSHLVAGTVSTRMSRRLDDGIVVLVQGFLVWVLMMFVILFFATGGFTMGSGFLLGAQQAPARPMTPAPREVPSSNMRAMEEFARNLASADVDEILSRLSDPRTADLIEAHTGLPRNEVELGLSNIRGRVAGARGDERRAQAEARQGVTQLLQAQKAPPAPTTEGSFMVTAWMTFVTMILSLAAALGGAFWGSRTSRA